MAGIGNNNVHRGPAKDKPYRDALRLEIEAAGDSQRSLRAIARAQIDKALEGDTHAIKEIADRLDGKVAQPIAGDQDNPLNVISEVRLTIVKPGHESSGGL